MIHSDVQATILPDGVIVNKAILLALDRGAIGTLVRRRHI